MSNPIPGKPPSRDDFQQAMQSMDTYIDITVDDLMELTKRAQVIARRNNAEASSITTIMTSPVRVVYPLTPLSYAAHIMVSQRVSGLPVVDDDDRLAGIITEADFLSALGMPASQPHHNLWQTLESLFNHLAHHGELEVPDDPVGEHMTRNVVCVDPRQELHDVIELMKQHRVKRVVVCDEERRVLGIVTRTDLVRIFFDCYTGLKREGK